MNFMHAEEDLKDSILFIGHFLRRQIRLRISFIK